MQDPDFANDIQNKKNELFLEYEKRKEKELVNLIANIIVDATFKEVYEKSNPLSPLQSRRTE